MEDCGGQDRIWLNPWAVLHLPRYLPFRKGHPELVQPTVGRLDVSMERVPASLLQQ